MNPKSFTVIELIIVIVVLIIVGISVTLLWSGHSLKLDVQALKLTHDIRYTQTLAMANNSVYRIVFNQAQHNYQITDSQGNLVYHPSIDALATIFFGSALTYASIQPSVSYLSFNGKGEPYIYSSCLQKLSTTLQIHITNGSQTKTIQVFPNTGYVTIAIS